MRERAILFVDGSNWYHGLREAGVLRPGFLDYRLVSGKLVQHRPWLGTRFYVGRVPTGGNSALYRDQRRFLADLPRGDSRITVHLGRLEPRVVSNPGVHELRAYLASTRSRFDPAAYRRLVEIAGRHARTVVMVEKAVDVMLAVDMAVLAERDAFDTAYLLSADGDFTPAVLAVQAHGKKVIAVSTRHGASLARVANTYIRLHPDWFSDCYS